MVIGFWMGILDGVMMGLKGRGIGYLGFCLGKSGGGLRGMGWQIMGICDGLLFSVPEYQR